MNPLLLSDIGRTSFMKNPAFAAAVNARAADEGSSMDAALFDVAWSLDDAGRVRVELPVGQAAKRFLDGIRGRVGFGRRLAAISMRSRRDRVSCSVETSRRAPRSGSSSRCTMGSGPPFSRDARPKPLAEPLHPRLGGAALVMELHSGVEHRASPTGMVDAFEKRLSMSAGWSRALRSLE